MALLQVIIGSTRPTRIGPAIAEWFAEEARTEGSFEIEVLDLQAVGLPFLDELQHPSLGQYAHEHTRAWSATITRGDAFVFVVPEYNHGYNAATKNAIDFLYHEWRDKPVGFLSYGGVSAGTRAVQGLRLVLSAVHAVPVPAAVSVPAVNTCFNPSGAFAPPVGLSHAAGLMLSELDRKQTALAVLRSSQSA